MKKSVKYLYFRIDFKNCPNVEYDYTIVENLEDIPDSIRIAELDLDDPSGNARVVITGVGMTRKEFNDWHKKNVIP